MNTACLILKAPRAGTVKTRLAREVGDKRAVQIYRLLVERQVHSLPPDWSVVVYFTPRDARVEMEEWLRPILRPVARFEPQCDGDLGLRLQFAVHQELERGAAHLFLMGGDCPDISTGYLQKADRMVLNHDLAIGPALDGGYVLLGLKKFHPTLFENINWSTPSVLVQTLAAAERASLSVGFLPTLDDIDDLDSWNRSVLARELEK